MSERTDQIIEELGYKPGKPKTNQPQTPNEAQGRDLFQTPNYAVDLLVPFIPKNIKRIWECAAGNGKITSRLMYHGYDTYSTDIRDDVSANFLTWDLKDQYTWCDCIITNPPFSLKQKFYNRCIYYGIPFALLIPADYSGWIIKAIQDGAEKIIPTRRIDYITPDTLNRVREGEVWKKAAKEQEFLSGWELKYYKKEHPNELLVLLEIYKDVGKYEKIGDVPNNILAEYSTSQFHSMWLTWGFGLGKSETFVQLTKEMKENI